MGRRSIACPSCRPLIPIAIREDLVRLYFAGLWHSNDPRWLRARDASHRALRALHLPRASRKSRGAPLTRSREVLA